MRIALAMALLLVTPFAVYADGSASLVIPLRFVIENKLVPTTLEQNGQSVQSQCLKDSTTAGLVVDGVGSPDANCVTFDSGVHQVMIVAK